MKKLLYLLMSWAVVLLMVSGASASIQGCNVTGSGGDPPLPVDGGWQGPYDEYIGGVGNFFFETWTLSGPASLHITDVYVPGDEFAVYDFGNLLGYSTPTGAAAWTADPETAWLTPFSHFDYLLGAGPHSITIQETAIPTGYSDSTYAISAVSAGGEVPEPTAIVVWSLLGGLGITAGWLRRRRAA
jgi:hypothetical protein